MDLEELKVELDEYGFVIIPDVIPKDHVQRLTDRAMEAMSRQPDFAERLEFSLPSMLEHMLDSDDLDLFISAVTIPVYLELARHTVGEKFHSAGEAMRWVKPGYGGQKFHADAPLVKGEPASPGVWPIINSLLMLSEFTRENGGTVILPFSHHSRRLPRPGVAYKHLVAAEGSPGSIVIFNGSIWHGTGSNVTKDNQRIGLSIAYHAAWLKHSWPFMKRSVHNRMPPMIQEMNKHVVED